MMDSVKRTAVACGLALLVLSQVVRGEEGPYLPVSLERYTEGEYTSDMSFRPADQVADATRQATVNGIPFEITRDERGNWMSVDVGPSRWREMKEDPLEFYPKWCEANAGAGDLVLHLPKGSYYRAHVLAVSDGQKGKDPVLTLRTGAFQGRAFLTDNTVDVPSFDATEVDVGLESVHGKFLSADGKVPSEGHVFLIPVAIRAGDLLKLMDFEPIETLDVQLTRRLHVKVSAPDPANFAILPLGAASGVRVFGITFERSPISLAVQSTSTSNVFPEARQPAFDLTVENRSNQPRNVELIASWRRDARGTQPQPDRQTWRLTLAAGEKRTIRHEPNCEEFGYYDYTVLLSDGGLGELFTHRTTFARLPEFSTAPLAPGVRSRFGVWWWNSAHQTPGSATAIDAVDWLGVGYPFAFSGEGDAINLMRARGMRPYKDDATLQFHEDAPAFGCMFYPSLFLGEGRYELSEEEEKNFQAKWDAAIARCTKIRQEQPELKIVFGNSTFNGVEEYLYRRFPAELFVALGHEACGLMRMPERQPELAALQEVYWFREALKEYGYKKDLWSTLEWQYHSTNPGNHSEQAQADLYVRDCLHALAYDFKRITPAAVENVGNGYYWSNWGASGLFTRAPDVHPKLSYVAYAVAAHVLSDADFVRAVPTGSHSAYCLEFDRRRGDKLFACWTICGSRSLAISGDFAGEVRLIDPQGNGRPLRAQGGALTFEITSSPVFIEGVKTCQETALGRPVYADPPDIPMRPITKLDSLDEWHLAAERSEVLDNGNFDMPRQKGEFEVSVVADDLKGRCLQFALKSRGHRPPWIPSYQAIELEEPIEIAGEPTALGLWVRGNSGWGRINLELRDATGERWLSIGQPMAWNANDEMSVSYIIFDGWRWMQIRLPGHYASGYHWPRFANWRNGTPEGEGDGVVDYPLSLTGVVVEQREQIIYVNEMIEASREPVRLWGLTAVYGDPEEVGDWAEHVETAR